jgi:cysteinyl-tRNA synthetase
VLGLDLDAPAESDRRELPAGASELLERRAAARAERDFATSDALREELAAMGVEVRDTPAGQVATPNR